MLRKIKNVIRNLIYLATFVLIVFGLKVCVYDHERGLDAAVAWCELKRNELNHNPDEFFARHASVIDQPRRQPQEVRLEYPDADHIQSLPARFEVTSGEPPVCTITYCMKIGLSICEYDYATGGTVVISD